MKPLEKVVVKILLDGINKLPHCKAIKVHTNSYMEAGTPDIIACIQGRMQLIEVKRDESKNPTKIQQQRLDEWDEAKAMTAVIKGVSQAKLFIQSIERFNLKTAIRDAML